MCALLACALTCCFCSCEKENTEDPSNPESPEMPDPETPDPGTDTQQDSTIEFTVSGVNFKMALVEHGTFQMGDDQPDAYSWCTPVHTVTLTNDYYMGQTEVTQALWKAVMGSNPSNHVGDNYPVENVSWDDVQVFLTKLNELTEKNFRLPTEAEWEYAARGGKSSKGYLYSGSNNIDDVAWYGDNSDTLTHAVGTKAPNELGLYDMSGNVWEWCQDWYGEYSSDSQTNPTGPASGSCRMERGGGWREFALLCRSANRYNSIPSFSSGRLGFRFALSK